VAYQANEFVNPNQRGVELPAGYKDLNELLEHKSAQQRELRTTFPLQRGSLKDVSKHVQAVYMESYGMSLLVTIRSAEAILCVHNRAGASKLSFLCRNQHTGLGPVIQDLSGHAGFREETREGVKAVSVLLPHLWLEAAEIVERVIRGYGTAENADLLFHFVTLAEHG
jgi:hypothetical protein